MIGSSWTRRDVLRIGGTVGSAVLAGCTLPGQSTENSKQQYRLGAIGYQSNYGQPHTLSIIVTFDDEIQFWDRFEIDDASVQNSVAETVYTGPERLVRYTVLASLNEDAHVRTDSTGLSFSSGGNDANHPCVGADILISENGRLSIRDMDDDDGSLCTDVE